MKFCTDHWSALRAAIHARGLSRLVAGSGEESMQRTVRELEGEADKRDYDPLMSAHWGICGQALKSGGLYLMTTKPDGSEYCPLCEVGTHLGAGEPAKWIDGCADSILDHCRKLGLVAVAG